MEARLFELFMKWDSFQDLTGQDDRLRAEKDPVLKEMREILSNRTYLRSILDDLVATTG